MKIEQRQLSEYSTPELKEIKQEFSELRVITQTYYGDDETSKVRQQLALDFFENAKKLGLKVFVVEGGSNDDFLRKVKEEFRGTVELLPESQVPEEDREKNGRVGIGTGRRYGFAKAFSDQNAKYFLWVEPEKSELLSVDNLRSCLKSLKNNKADVTVPKRMDKDSMVPFQAWIETWANKIAGKLLAGKKIDKLELPQDATTESYFKQRPLDLWFGPKVFNRAGANEFIRYLSNLDKWDATIAPASNAELSGLRVNSVDVAYNYDLSQRRNEEGNKAMDKRRWEQFLSILTELGSQEAGVFYNRMKNGEYSETFIQEIIAAFNMDDEMPDNIKKYLNIS